MSEMWFNDCSAGSEELVSGHKEILNLIFRISYLIGKRDCAALPATFEMLENRLHAYFEAEEKSAQSGSHDFTRHKLEHKSLLEDFQRIRNMLEAKQCRWADGEENVFTNSWVKCFVQHIKESGRTLAASSAIPWDGLQSA